MSSRKDHPESTVSSRRLQAIVDETYSSMQVIEQWRSTSTDHPQLHQIIQKIREHAQISSEAINTSLKAAQNGCRFGCDAIALCGNLLDPKLDRAQLEKCIPNIQYKTKRTQEDFVITLSKFGDVRKGLVEAKNMVSMERLAGQEVGKGIYVRLSPLVLGEGKWLNQMLMKVLLISHTGRYTELDAARKQLGQLASSIEELIGSFDKLATWWTEIRTVVEKLEAMTDVLRAEEKLRVKTIQRCWQIIRDDYEKYKAEISLLERHHNIQDPSGPESTAQCKVLGAIFESSLDSLQIMDPWRKASTDHPHVQQIILKIRDHALLYFEAIDASLKAAQYGYYLSRDAIELCGHLLDPKADRAQFEKHISDIKHKAKRTHEDSMAILDKFQKVRRGLFKTTNKIPKRAIMSPEIDKRTSITLVSSIVGDERDLSLDTALKQLNLTALDVAKLVDNATKFTDWWTAAEIVSEIAEDDSNALREMKGEVQTKGAQRTWIDIRDKYKQYKDQIIQLQNHYNADPLRELEGVSPFEDLKAIVEAAFTSLQMIKPWSNATTEHPQLQQVVKKIQSHAVIYLDAIDTSIKTAQDGYAFISDAIELCGYLIDPVTDIKELREYIEKMCRKSKSARNDSTIALGKFRDVRKGLIEIGKTIPQEPLVNSNSFRKKKAVIRVWSRVFGEKRDIDLDAAMKELDLVALDVVKLADEVGKFAGWWAEMETALTKVEKDAIGLRPGKDKIRVQVIKKQWAIIRDDYKQYKAQAIRLQDYLSDK